MFSLLLKGFSSEMPSPPNVSEVRVPLRLWQIPVSCLQELPHQHWASGTSAFACSPGKQDCQVPCCTSCFQWSIAQKFRYLCYVHLWSEPSLEIWKYVFKLSQAEEGTKLSFPVPGRHPQDNGEKEVMCSNMVLWYSLVTLQPQKCWVGDVECKSRTVFPAWLYHVKAIIEYHTSNLMKLVGL